jgi:type III secretory pathway lipoprotein EscJ
LRVRHRPLAVALAALAALTALTALVDACAPVVDAPAQAARDVDLADGNRLAAELAALPGAWSAHATLHRAFRDPVTNASSPASASVLVVIDDSVDRAATQRAAEALARAAIPEITGAAVVVEVEVGSPRPVLAGVGPFRVERGSRTPLIATLAGGLVIIAGLALALARKTRRGVH